MTQTELEQASAGDSSGARAGQLLTRLPVVCGLAVFCNLLWGSASPCIKIGYELFAIDASDTAAQLLFAGLRFTLAGLLTLLFGSLAARRPLRPKRSSLGYIVRIGLAQTVVQYLFFYIGVAHTTAAKTSILASSSGFLAILLATCVLRQEKLTARKLLGCGLGFAGVVLVNLGGGLVLTARLDGEGFILLSAAAYAVSSVLVKRYSAYESPVVLSGCQFVWGGLVLAAAGWLAGGRLTVLPPTGLALLVYLAFLSAAAYSFWALLLQYNPISRISVFTFINPICGVFLSALLLGEASAFGPTGAAALLLVCAGIWLVNRKPEASAR